MRSFRSNPNRGGILLLSTGVWSATPTGLVGNPSVSMHIDLETGFQSGDRRRMSARATRHASAVAAGPWVSVAVGDSHRQLAADLSYSPNAVSRLAFSREYRCALRRLASIGASDRCDIRYPLPLLRSHPGAPAASAADGSRLLARSVGDRGSRLRQGFLDPRWTERADVRRLSDGEMEEGVQTF